MMMRLMKYILLLVIAVVGISFACLNAERVQINYYVNTTTVPLSLLLVLTFVLGGLVALLFSLKILVVSKRRQHHLKKQLQLLQNKDDH